MRSLNPDKLAVRAAALLTIAGMAPLARGQFQKGANLVLFGQTVDPAILDQSFDGMAAVGIDHVAIDAFWFQDNINSTTVSPRFDRYSATDSTLIQMINAAHAHGMSVMLRPMVDLANDPSHWRGQIIGGSSWFTGSNGYGDYINHMATLAQQNDVELLSVGAELVATDSQTSDWRNLIFGVRSRYSGSITYGANWGNPAIGSTVNWWDAVDYMGIDAYYPLTSINNPTPAQLQSAWTTRAAQIDSYHSSVAPTKPLLFTEVGYTAQDGTNTSPAGLSGNPPMDQQEQADAYQAMLAAMTQRSYFAGLYSWAWDAAPNPDPAGFNIEGKLVADVLSSYFVAGYTLGGSFTGATSGAFNDNSNWSNGAAPGNLVSVTFNSGAGGHTTIALAAPTTVARLVFDTSSSAAFNFASSSTLTFNAGGGITITDKVTTSQTFNLPISVLGTTIFANNSKTAGQLLSINGTLNAGTIGTQRISLVGNGKGAINGAISDGAGQISLFKNGTSTWTLGGNNSFSGEVDVAWGTLALNNGAALGSSAGITRVLRGASIVLNPGLTVAAEPLEIAGDGQNGQGALQRPDVGPYTQTTWNGPITINGDAKIQNLAYNNPASPTNVFVLGGKITGGSQSGTLNFASGNSNPGFFQLAAHSDYLGTTLISGGKVILAGGDNTLPVTSVVKLDTFGRGAGVEAGVLDLNGNDQTIAGLTNVAQATAPRVINSTSGSTSQLTISTPTGTDVAFAGSVQNGAGGIRVIKDGLGKQTFGNASTYAGGTTVSAGTLALAHPDAIGVGSLAVGASGFVVAQPSLARSLYIGGHLTIDAGGRFDMGNNQLVLDYTSSDTQAADLRAALWDGRLFSTSSDVAHRLAYADNATLGLSIFGNRTIDATSLLFAYDYAGDTNLDGKVDIADLGQLAGHWQSSGADWQTGDFTYDGVVNISDLGLLAGNWQAGVAAGSAPLANLDAALAALGLPATGVPEPSSLPVACCGLLIVGLSPGLGARERKNARSIS